MIFITLCLYFGLMFDNGVHQNALGCAMNSMVYPSVGSTHKFDGQWKTLNKKVYFHVGDDVKSFRLTYRGKVVTEGAVPNIKK